MEFLPSDIQSFLLKLAGSTTQSAARLVLVLLGGAIAARVLRALIGHLETALVRAGERTGTLPGVARARVATLTSVVRTLALVVLWSVVTVICLSQLGLDVRPILAGAGIVGLAVGFGAQYLVRDVIAGFFLVLGAHVPSSAVAVVNGTGGVVETVTFRTIVMRDVAGTVHIFPNGSVSTLANMTKGWSGYVVDVEIGYREDPDRVMALMRRVFEELHRDPVHGPLILEPIEVFGVDGFKEAGLVIKARLKTLPVHQWTVGREYRRRLVLAFAAEGISAPSRVLSVVEPGQPLPVLLMQGAGPAPGGPLPR